MIRAFHPGEKLTSSSQSSRFPFAPSSTYPRELKSCLKADCGSQALVSQAPYTTQREVITDPSVGIHRRRSDGHMGGSGEDHGRGETARDQASLVDPIRDSLSDAHELGPLLSTVEIEDQRPCYSEE
eukprot:6932945-Pyramimonas_sp.AAC.1